MVFGFGTAIPFLGRLAEAMKLVHAACQKRGELMNYFLCLIAPPAGVWLAGKRLQAAASLVLFVLALTFFNIALNDGPPGAYAAGPVLYIFTVIHSFIFMHRHYQKERGTNHPHRERR